MMMLEKPKPTRMLTRMMAAIEAPAVDAERIKEMLRPREDTAEDADGDVPDVAANDEVAE